MTISEYLEKNNMSSAALARVMGVANSVITNAKKGQKMSATVTEKFLALGIEVNGSRFNSNEKNLPTIKEVMERDNIGPYVFAKRYGVGAGFVYTAIRDDYTGCRRDIAEKLEKRGIFCPIIDYTKTSSKISKTCTAKKEKNAEPIKKVAKKTRKQLWEEKTWLKEFQVSAIKKFGNTIVSTKHSKEDIISEYKKFGINVECREFKTYYYSKSHYVVVDIDFVGR